MTAENRTSPNPLPTAEQRRAAWLRSALATRPGDPWADDWRRHLADLEAQQQAPQPCTATIRRSAPIRPMAPLADRSAADVAAQARRVLGYLLRSPLRPAEVERLESLGARLLGELVAREDQQQQASADRRERLTRRRRDHEADADEQEAAP